MPKYIVTWTVFHLAKVDADNPDDAPAKAKEFAASHNTAVSSSDVTVLQRPEEEGENNV